MANEELIRLNYESIRNIWMNVNNRHVCLAFRQIQRQVNNPPLLFLRNRDNNNLMMRSSRQINGLNHSPSNGMTEIIYSELESQIIALQDKQSNVEMAKQECDYKQARVDFFSRNTPKLGKIMKNQEIKITKDLQILKKKQQEIATKGTLDPILSVNGNDQAKINVVARHEAMKEGERHLVSCLQKSMRELGVSFDENKGLLRSFYEQMFDSQLEYLKLCQ